MAENTFASLFSTYLREATPFAVIHAVLLLACLRVWVKETLRIRAVRAQLVSARAGAKPSADTTLGQAFDYAVGLAVKGRLVDPGSLQSFFRTAWQSADGPFHAFLNAFVISGILGTLYNLWRIRGVLEQIVSSNATAQTSVGVVGVAFAASIFGLAYALAFGATDALIFQPRRDRLLNDVVEWLANETVERTPVSAEAILARSIDDLREFNKEVVQGVATGLETLAREYASRFDGLATKAKGDMDHITAEWSQALKNSRKVLDTASTRVSQASDRLDQKRESIETALKTVADTQATLTGSVNSVETTVSGLLKDTRSQIKKSADAWQKITSAHESRLLTVQDGVGKEAEAAVHAITSGTNAALKKVADTEASLTEMASTVQDTVKKEADAGVQAITSVTDAALKKVADTEASLTETVSAVQNTVKKEADAGVQAITSATDVALKKVADTEASLTATVGAVKNTVSTLLMDARTQLEQVIPDRRTLASYPANPIDHFQEGVREINRGAKPIATNATEGLDAGVYVRNCQKITLPYVGLVMIRCPTDGGHRLGGGAPVQAA